MNRLLKAVPSRERGAALIIVLAFVVLLTGLGVAYFSRTTSDRQVAHSSFNQSNVDQLAQSAMDNIIGDLRQEIVDGSSAVTLSPTPPAGSSTLYVPSAAANMVPQRSGNPASVPNLIRRSVRSDGIQPPSRASAVNSTTDPSANGRAITSTRWNSHYLVPKKYTGTDDSLPIDDFTNATPDWVFVTNTGATPSPAPADVIGRYAYAIYDEGGLLDMNLAGYPTRTTVSQSSGKMSLAFADLTALPYPIPNGPPPAGAAYQVDKLVGWRNYATTQPTNSFPDSDFAVNFQTSSGPATSFYNFVVGNPWGPLQVRSDISLYNGRTDQMFLGRQELIGFRTTTQFAANALQYLGTFSREAAAGAPQWSGPSPTPTSVNPNFQTLLVTTSFTRNDGTTANVGDPLVNKPFLLRRLNWLTYKGPSGENNRYRSNDADIRILEDTYGVASSFLQQGTNANILNYFGLAWDATNERWNYVGHGGSPMPIDSIATFGPGGTQSATRPLDFFELLQAGILDGSLGDAASPDPALPLTHQQSKMLHILTIGANLIAQARTDSYPVRIACSVGGTIMEAVGMPRLPCLNSLAACAVGATQPAGGVNWFLIPNLWDPFRNTWDLTSTANPTYPRPPIRIRIQGSVAFGSIAASQSVVSGSAQSGVTTFSSGSINGINDSNLTLVTGATLNNWHGRDGFLEAMRLRTNDISNTVNPFTPTNSPLTPNEWNSLPTTNMTQVGPGGNQLWIVYRVSLAGSSIPDPGAFTPGQNPVLILKPGFQVTIEYKSPNGSWYPYSFLQGNNESSTWIGNTTPTRNLNLVTDYSIYGKISGTIPTLVNSSSSGTATPWATATLADAPMFAKADPRSIRFNSQIGVLNITSPPMASASAGIVGTLWPDAYTTAPTPTPPLFWTTTSPGPTPSPNPNPALYSQTSGDNAAAGSNPYDENAAVPTQGDAVRPIVLNRPFRNVGAMGYAFRDQPFRTLSFSSNPSPDAGLLELFSANNYPTPSPTATPYSAPTPTPRAGVISLNSRQSGAIAATLAGAIRKENITPSLLTATDANSVGTSLASLAIPVINRGGLAALVANETGLGASVPKTERESIARALGEAGQTRTWNLLIDVIAQSGKYAPGETDLKKFVVGGEQRYWVHVAIDRFTGYVIDKQIEVVNE